MKPNPEPLAPAHVSDDHVPDPSHAVKDPHAWKTGGESMTDAQASYLQTLCTEAKVEFDATLSKAQASELIDRLQEQTGRGKTH